MAERGASDSEGSDIPDVEENVRGDSDDETLADPLDRAQDVFVDNGNDNDGSQPRLVANLLGESSDSDDEFLGFDTDWVTDPRLFRRGRIPQCSLDGGSTFDHPEETTAAYYFGLFWDDEVTS